MKFDILKYINDRCESYLQDDRIKAFVLSDIRMALDDRSWQNLCDGHEAVDDIVEADDQKWYVHPDWCIETEDDK